MADARPIEIVWENGGAGGGTGAFVGIDLGTSNSCMAVWHPAKSRAKVRRWNIQSPALKGPHETPL
jgi:hypothetical protein